MDVFLATTSVRFNQKDVRPATHHISLPLVVTAVSIQLDVCSVARKRSIFQRGCADPSADDRFSDAGIALCRGSVLSGPFRPAVVFPVVVGSWGDLSARSMPQISGVLSSKNPVDLFLGMPSQTTSRNSTGNVSYTSQADQVRPHLPDQLSNMSATCVQALGLAVRRCCWRVISWLTPTEAERCLGRLPGQSLKRLGCSRPRASSSKRAACLARLRSSPISASTAPRP
eukprot:3310428-Rhodomonas_salina.2